MIVDIGLAALAIVVVGGVIVLVRAYQVITAPLRPDHSERDMRRRDHAAGPAVDLADYALGQGWHPGGEAELAPHADRIAEFAVAQHDPDRLTGTPYAGLAAVGYTVRFADCFTGPFLGGRVTVANAWAESSAAADVGLRQGGMSKDYPAAVAVLRPGRPLADLTIRPHAWRVHMPHLHRPHQTGDPEFDRHYLISAPSPGPASPVTEPLGPGLLAAIMARSDWSFAVRADAVLVVRAHPFESGTDLEDFLVAIEQVVTALPDRFQADDVIP